MNSKSLIKTSLLMSEHVLFAYLSDLSEVDLFKQPSPKSNSLAWQLGHLIISENEALELMGAGSLIMPEGFKLAHASDKAPVPQKLWSMTEYFKLFKEQRSLTHKFLDELQDSQLSSPAPEKMRGYAPTVADLLLAQGGHLLMHAGQIAVLRRELDKPILI